MRSRSHGKRSIRSKGAPDPQLAPFAPDSPLELAEDGNGAGWSSGTPYRTIVEACPFPILVEDEDTIVYANSAAARQFGAACADDLIGLAWTQATDPDGRIETQPCIPTAPDLAIGPVSGGCIWRRLDGTRFQADAAARLVQWGAKSAMLWVFPIQNQALNAPSPQPDHFLRDLPCATYRRVLRPDGTISYEHGDRGAPDHPGHILDDQSVHPDDRAAYQRAIHTSAASLEPFDALCRYLTPDGEVRYARSVANPNRLDNGDVVWDGICIDVTGYHRALDTLRHSEELQKREIVALHREQETLTEQNAKLIATVRDLALSHEAADQANAAKSRFLAAISHDLRQPLKALSLLSYALGSQLDNRETSQTYQDMRQTLTVMEGLLNKLLEVSRLEAGDVLPYYEDFGADVILEPLRAEFEQQALERGLDLRFIGCHARIHTDYELVTSIVRNLISNALKYTEAGRVVVGCRRCAGALRFEVWDTGIGIPSEMLDKIFDEFIRLPTPHDGTISGFGIGLAVAKRAARILNVELTVRSTPNRGSVFAVAIPLAE